MKTAIIFYGFFRTFDFCNWTLSKHILKPLDADVFFSTYDSFYAKKEDEVPNYHKLFSKNDKKLNEETINFFGDKLIDYEIRTYHSQWYKNFLIQNDMPMYIDLTQQHGWRVLSSLHSVSLSINLFKRYVEKTNSHYDLVIVTRPDIRYYTDFKPETIDLNKINCPSFFAIDPEHPELNIFTEETKKDINVRRRAGGAGVHGFNRWLNDNILVGSQENILKFFDVFDKTKSYVEEGICFNYETIIGAHMIKNNIEFTDNDFIVYELWRPDRYDW